MKAHAATSAQYFFQDKITHLRYCIIVPITAGLSIEINEDLAREEVEGALNGSKDTK